MHEDGVWSCVLGCDAVGDVAHYLQCPHMNQILQRQFSVSVAGAPCLHLCGLEGGRTVVYGWSVACAAYHSLKFGHRNQIVTARETKSFCLTKFANVVGAWSGTIVIYRESIGRRLRL